MICKYCGERIPDDAKFCANCGNIVENEDIQMPSGYCPNCGSPVYGDNTVCGKCGQRLDAYDNAYDTEQPQYVEQSEAIYSDATEKKNGSNTTLIVVLIIVIVALIGGIIAFFVFKDNFIQPKDNNSQNALVEEQKKNDKTSNSEKTPKPINTPTPAKTPEPTSPPAPTVPPAQPVNSSVNTNPGVSEYMFALDTKLITESDLSKLSQAETRLLLNELYARHGYIFTLQEYRDYFSKKTWYTPRYTSQSDAEAQFNSIELQNKNIIANYEKSKGWR